MTSTVTDRIAGVSTGLAIKAPVRVASTSNLTLSGLQTVDGVLLASGDRVLVKGQTDSTENGIYDADSGTWERSVDFDGNRDIAQGTIVSVVSGSVNSNSYWRVTTANPITVDSSSITFAAALIDDAASVVYLSPDTDAIPVSVASIHRSRVRPQYFGAQGDGVTNDTAFILKAMQRAANRNCLCEIPGTDLGYRLNTAIVAANLDYLQVEGEGILIPVGGNALTVDSSIHVSISGIGIYGTAGSGHGIELVNGSHYGKYRNIWIGWVDGDGIHVTSGQSNTYTDVDIDQNIGFRPVVLQGGLTDGAVDRGVYVPYNALGNGNNQSFVNCRINAAGAVTSLQVGDAAGAGLVDSFSWVGGLIQGSDVYKEVYLRTRDGSIAGAHIEPPVGATANYVVTLDRCQNTIIRDCCVQGDAVFSGACIQTGFEHVRGAGVNISDTSIGCFVRDGQYRNIITGPTGGDIRDTSSNADIRNMINASVDYQHTGESSAPCRAEYLRSNFESWLGGASPSMPAGISQSGGTLTRDSLVVKSGTYAAKMVMSADLTQYIGVQLLPIEEIRGKTVTVEAWVYNLTTAGLAFVGGITVGGAAAGSRYEPTHQSDVWERVLVTFVVPTDASTFQVRLTGTIGTVYWDQIVISVDGFEGAKQMALANSGTPDVTQGGRMVPTVLTGGTTTITDFAGAHPGVPFTVLGRHTVTITHNATKLVTKTGSDISMADGKVARFMRGLDTGYIYEI